MTARKKATSKVGPRKQVMVKKATRKRPENGRRTQHIRKPRCKRCDERDTARAKLRESKPKFLGSLGKWFTDDKHVEALPNYGVPENR